MGDWSIWIEFGHQIVEIYDASFGMKIITIRIMMLLMLIELPAESLVFFRFDFVCRFMIDRNRAGEDTRKKGDTKRKQNQRSRHYRWNGWQFVFVSCFFFGGGECCCC